MYSTISALEHAHEHVGADLGEQMGRDWNACRLQHGDHLNKAGHSTAMAEIRHRHVAYAEANELSEGGGTGERLSGRQRSGDCAGDVRGSPQRSSAGRGSSSQ